MVLSPILDEAPAKGNLALLAVTEGYANPDWEIVQPHAWELDCSTRLQEMLTQEKHPDDYWDALHHQLAQELVSQLRDGEGICAVWERLGKNPARLVWAFDGNVFALWSNNRDLTAPKEEKTTWRGCTCDQARVYDDGGRWEQPKFYAVNRQGLLEQALPEVAAAAQNPDPNECPALDQQGPIGLFLAYLVAGQERLLDHMEYYHDPKAYEAKHRSPEPTAE